MNLKSLLPSLVPILGVIGLAFAAPAQAYLSAHPLVFAAVSALLGVVNHWIPSPASPK